MKKINLVLHIFIALVIYFIFFFFFRGLSNTFNLGWTKDTGTLGDTFGGFLSPLIGLAGFYFIYETFKAQREQLDDQKAANDAQGRQLKEQREQYHVSRITDIIYLQFGRINESIKSQAFLFTETETYLQTSLPGYTGLYSLNNKLKRTFLNTTYLNSFDKKDLRARLIYDNITQLTEIYENIATAIAVIENLSKDSGLTPDLVYELKRILGLNLGNVLMVNVEQMHSYMNWHMENATQLDTIWESENAIAMLNQFVTITHDFFIEVVGASRNHETGLNS